MMRSAEPFLSVCATSSYKLSTLWRASGHTRMAWLKTCTYSCAPSESRLFQTSRNEARVTNRALDPCKVVPCDRDAPRDRHRCALGCGVSRNARVSACEHIDAPGWYRHAMGKT